ncbi:MAG: hypothetical protein K9L66_00375 [Spirochaetaceae bacterium]|nr:hypothetical protein [Spirochaetaceae bacterium]MCF7947202.1 hypothetical protein [Spirochaetia bacterium]MCF7950067.1 hypothetical protein [Spirochaetaceae bacterium]
MSRWINWNPTGVQIDDEKHTPDAAAYSLRHDAWKNLEVWTGAGKAGTQLVEGTDYQLDSEKTLTNAFGESALVHTQVQIINAAYEGVELYHSYAAVADFQKAINGKLAAASVPGHYGRNIRWRVKGNTGSDRYTLVSPDELTVNINGYGYVLESQIEIRLNETASWDDLTTDWTTPANRAGQDFYIYACEPEAGYVPVFILSANSTFPSGYTADNSRKVGQFHCLCADIGTDVYPYENRGKDEDYFNEAFAAEQSLSNGDVKHWLEGFLVGDILPHSVQDILHRPHEGASREGAVFSPKDNRWGMIYLPSWDAAQLKLVSVYGADPADGTSLEKFHANRFDQDLGAVGYMSISRQEHVNMSLGSPQGVNISGSADPGNTGGHVATNGQRIVSLIGMEDMTGVQYQWGRDSTSNSRSSWGNNFDANDVNVAGQDYSMPNRSRFGVNWSDGAYCGSRGAHATHAALILSANGAGRGVAEPKGSA